MQDQRLFISVEEYHGLPRPKPTIPLGEIWVFKMHNGEIITASGGDEDFSPPPYRPMLHKALLYKLHEQATYTIQQKYLTESPYPTTITWSITAEVSDAKAYFKSGQYKSDNFPKIKAIVAAKLQGEIEDSLLKYFNQPFITKPDDHQIPLIKRILTKRDYSSKVRGSLNDIGLKLVVIADNLECSAYQALSERATTGIQRTFMDERERLLRAATDLRIALDRLHFDEERINSIVGLVEIHKINLTLIEKALDQLGQVADTAAAAQLIRQLVASNPNPLQQPSPGMTPGGNSSAQGQLPSGDRDTQIQQLYQAAQNKGWKLSPPQAGKGEMIQVGLKNKRELELVVPKNYPGGEARIMKATSQGTRVSKLQIDRKVKGITAGTYNLVSLVEELDNSIQ